MVTWIGVVQQELSILDPVNDRLEKCLTVRAWEKWPPAWWPETLGLEENLH